MVETCKNVREAPAPNPEHPGQTVDKVCGFDLTEARKVRGDDLVRCPECGRKLP